MFYQFPVFFPALKTESKLARIIFQFVPQIQNAHTFLQKQADIDSVYRLKSGNYRLFWNTIDNDLGSCKLTSTLWIKAPINKHAFSLNTEDITKGLVNYSQNCSCCLLIEVKPISGYVKGINTNLEKRADQTKWLIEAEIVLAASHTNRPIDTLYVKQYFYPNFVYD